MRQSRPTTSSQAPHKSSSNTATQQQHNGNNGNKKKPKYVKLTMSSKRFNMLALHVLTACLLAPYTPTLHLLHSSPSPPLPTDCQPVSFLCMRLQGKSFQSF